jgi:hypothetical protein
MTETETRPPIPASLTSRPVRGGLAMPWANAELADGGVDFRSPHYARFAAAWTKCLCQSCGNPAGDPAVLICGPRQILHRKYDEPPLCPPCALYVTRACPVVNGRTEVYPSRLRLTEGHRGKKCAEPGCDCGGWRVTGPEHSADQGGQPVLPWYACWIHPADFTVTAHRTVSRCADKGCEHERLIVNGCLLNVPPLKIYLVSEPGNGRIWRRLTQDEAVTHATAALPPTERKER